MIYRIEVVILIVLLYSEGVSSERHYSVVTNRCSRLFCGTIYRYERKINWEYAVMICTDNNQTIISIRTGTAQRTVKDLLKEIDQSNEQEIHVGAWVGGRQTNNPDWRHVRRTASPSINISGLESASSGMNCVFMDLQSVEVAADECTEIRGGHRTVCQRPVWNESNCQVSSDGASSAVWYSGVCYIIMSGTHSWYQAMTECWMKRSSRLITANLDNNIFIEMLSNNLHTTDTNKTIWLGVTRYPWVWQTGADSFQNMLYYNWQDLHDKDTDGDYCVYAKPNGKWASLLCSNQPTRFFICSGPVASTPSTTSSMTTAPATSLVSSAGETTASPLTGVNTVPTTASPLTGVNTPPLEYIIPGVIVGILAIVIPVTVCLLLGRRRKKAGSTSRSAPNRYANENIYTNANDIAITSSGNALTSQHDNHVNHLMEPDVITPYSEFNPQTEHDDFTGVHNSALTPAEETILDNNEKDQKTDDTSPAELVEDTTDDVPRVKTPQGDVYALSTNDKRFLDAPTSEDGPTAPDNPYLLAGDDQTPTGSDENIHHVVTKEGDVYALSTNDKRFPVKN